MTEQSLITTAVGAILRDLEAIQKRHWRVTDVMVDLSAKYAVLRVVCSKWPNGTAVRLFVKPHPWDMPESQLELVVYWEQVRGSGVIAATDLGRMSGVAILAAGNLE